jgi:hypothetical protein
MAGLLTGWKTTVPQSAAAGKAGRESGDDGSMSEDLPFFHRMLVALLEAPEDIEMDRMRARLTLDSVGSEAVEAAIEAGDVHAAALWRLALGETRASLRRRIEAKN